MNIQLVVAFRCKAWEQRALKALARGEITVPGLDLGGRYGGGHGGGGDGGPGGARPLPARDGAERERAAWEHVRAMDGVQGVDALCRSLCLPLSPLSSASTNIHLLVPSTHKHTHTTTHQAAGASWDDDAPVPTGRDDAASARPGAVQSVRAADGGPGPWLGRDLIAALRAGGLISAECKDVILGPVIRVEREADIFAALQLDYVPPHMRSSVA